MHDSERDRIVGRWLSGHKGILFKVVPEGECVDERRRSRLGFFIIDTRALANGLHTIAWVVRDSAGRGAGVGSRFFSVFNASTSR